MLGSKRQTGKKAEESQMERANPQPEMAHTENWSNSTIMISLIHRENILKERSKLPVSSVACSWRNFVNKTLIFDTQNALVILHVENRIPAQTPLRQLEKDWRDSKWRPQLSPLTRKLRCYFDFKQNVWTK